jgi:exosortase D (VPLPA-CTERM-specific)
MAGARPANGAVGPALLAAAFAAAALTFWGGMEALVAAWSVPEYSHGPIIPLISLFLFLREMRAVPPSAAPVRDRWAGAPVILVGVAIGLLGALSRIPDLVMYGLIVWCAGMVLSCFGLRRGALFWPAVLHLVFMLPLPQFVYWQVSITLQMISSEIGVWLIRLVDIPVYLDGNIIDLGVYKLQVAEACSGLRYLFPMLSFSYVFAVLYQGPWWHKVIMLAMAAPITVAMNSFRIGMIGVLVNSYGIEHAEGFLHTFEGWVIFLACVLILFGTATLLQRLSPSPRPLSETLDIEFAGLGDQLRRFWRVPATAPLAFAVATTALAGAAWNLAPERTIVTPDRPAFVLFPRAVDGWTGSSQTLSRDIEAVLGADDYLSAAYAHEGEAAPVDLFAAYYRRQTEGSGIHSPEVCIPAGGWEVSAWRPTEVVLGGGERLTVNRAIIQKGVNRQLVYFWFEQRGRTMTSDYRVKMHAIADSITTGRSDGGIVRLITPIGLREREELADARLVRFLDAARPEISRFFPQ